MSEDDGGLKVRKISDQFKDGFHKMAMKELMDKQIGDFKKQNLGQQLNQQANANTKKK